MYRFSFKIRHKGCYETGCSIKFPKHNITVIDIQSLSSREKQYFYYITGNPKQFDSIIKYLKKSKGYKLIKETERSKDTLLLLVVLNQASYIQNIIQKYNGFLIDLHTVLDGYEYWHVGVLDKSFINKMLKELRKMGDLKTLHIGEVDFVNRLLSEQQKKIFSYAHEQGYYNIPRKTTIAKIATALKLNASTVGEHLLKAENKIINSMAKKL